MAEFNTSTYKIFEGGRWAEYKKAVVMRISQSDDEDGIYIYETEKPAPTDIVLEGKELKDFIQTLHVSRYVSHELEYCHLKTLDGRRAYFIGTHPSGYTFVGQKTDEKSKILKHIMVYVPRDILAQPYYNLYTDGILYTIQDHEPVKPKPFRMGQQHQSIMDILKGHPHGLTSRQILTELNKVKGYETAEMQSVSGRCSELSGAGKIASGGMVNDEVSGNPRNIWLRVVP